MVELVITNHLLQRILHEFEQENINIPVTYVLYPDEGHALVRPENRLSFFAVAELFLAEHLGGRSEAIGDDFQHSSLDIRTGIDHIPGLREAVYE